MTSYPPPPQFPIIGEIPSHIGGHKLFSVKSGNNYDIWDALYFTTSNPVEGIGGHMHVIFSLFLLALPNTLNVSYKQHLMRGQYPPPSSSPPVPNIPPQSSSLGETL